jgi:hypothetical protein
LFPDLDKARFAFIRRNRFIGKRLAHRGFEIRPSLLDQAIAELITQRFAFDFQNRAFGQFTQLERSVGNTDQAVHFKAERTEYVLDLAVLAFPQSDRQPDVSTLLTFYLGFDGAIKNTVDRDAVLQFVEPFLLDLTMRTHAVTAQPAGLRQFEDTGESTVIGQEKQSFGVDVQTAYRQNARQFGGQFFEDRRAALRVPVGCHQPGRLVIEPKPRALSISGIGLPSTRIFS